jgi:hypothetical protein
MYDRDLVESGAFRRIARAIHGSQAGVSFVEIEFTRGHEFETQVSRRHNAEFESQFPPRAKNLSRLAPGRRPLATSTGTDHGRPWLNPVPNNGKLPLIVYRGPIRAAGAADPAALFEVTAVRLTEGTISA